MFYMFLTAFKAFVLVHLGAHSSPKVKKIRILTTVKILTHFELYQRLLHGFHIEYHFNKFLDRHR